MFIDIHSNKNSNAFTAGPYFEKLLTNLKLNCFGSKFFIKALCDMLFLPFSQGEERSSQPVGVAW